MDAFHGGFSPQHAGRQRFALFKTPSKPLLVDQGGPIPMETLSLAAPNAVSRKKTGTVAGNRS
jgi:hypothetical protein